ncbi:MAG: twin-arginine translocation signal domain-containing protein, partial [Paramuribaculum sp.]|nr:twin-arginine translocation signal domain-containing protein [Paramuribaculum sp.]
MEKHNINRRDFLKRLGLGAGLTGLALAGCDSASKKISSDNSALSEVPTDKMTYRINPKTGEKVSILGYGCMRWPTIAGENEGEEVLDQETINRLVDTAIAHGVNYFDTSPAYCKCKSVLATGLA